ncbi:6-bladed beta-propeller [Parapedobacter sp. 10938]|uniref:6-bladed beta-propeller n=1 Tax=Parapedobacter flavus TaxID=3110225 RepID=UPI002DBCEBF7|nr:6-bladed beta-propeller [Parapedobacter sp. 10938]MEC3880925.1 6-bladed beta-propeller [Parapedobacter sp. 10938]
MRPKVSKTLHRLILFVFHGAFLSSICLGESLTKQDSTAAVTEIRVDLAAATGGVDAVLFDSIAYIPLETNEHSAFSNISQLEVTDGYFIILDKRINSFFFFHRDGSFSHKIDKNNENEPFKSVDKFAIDRSRGVLSFRDTWAPHGPYTFGLDGSFIEVAEWDSMVSFRDFTLFNGFKICYQPRSHHSETDDDRAHFENIVRYDARTGERLGAYLPVDSTRKNTDLFGVSKYFYRSDQNRLLFTQPYDYAIYEFDTNAVPHERFKIILPRFNTLPFDFLTNPEYHGKWRDYLKANKSVIYSIRDVYLSGNWLSFNTSPSIKRSAFLYNLNTYELFNLKETEDSALGLPVTENFRPILAVDHGALISEVSFVALKKQYEETPRPQQRDLFPQNLNVLMKKESHNPILRLSYLKQ